MATDPLLLSSETSVLVEQGSRRRISRIVLAGACQGCVTLYVAGCNLRCIHCWADDTREDPGRCELLSPLEAARQVGRFLDEDRLLRGQGLIRLSGGEPILSKSSIQFIARLRGLLDQDMIVETNGILLGADESLAEELARIRPSPPKVRLSLKAAWPESFERLTGAVGWASELPFIGIQRLQRAGIPFDLEAVSLCPDLISEEERQDLLARLGRMNGGLLSFLSEEALTPYPKTIERMEQARKAREAPQQGSL